MKLQTAVAFSAILLGLSVAPAIAQDSKMKMAKMSDKDKMMAMEKMSNEDKAMLFDKMSDSDKSMATKMAGVMQHLFELVLRDGAGMTDGQLLNAFVRQRDDSALAALVDRHGPMVWGVCHRLLRNHHDAEDAFQATFLVLVHKAAAVRDKDAVANWLYGVAHQTAVRVRSTVAKRQGREQAMNDTPELATKESDLGHDPLPLLDQEMSRLPDKYRVLIV